MTAFKYNLNIDQGATFSDKVVWKTGELKTPVDLTGCTAKMQIRDKVESPTLLLELNTSNNSIILGGVAGTIEFNISAQITEQIKWKTGVYDMKITFPDGKVIKKLYGSVTVTSSITRN